MTCFESTGGFAPINHFAPEFPILLQYSDLVLWFTHRHSLQSDSPERQTLRLGLTSMLPLELVPDCPGEPLDRLTHHVHILEMNGESYRLKRSRENAAAQAPDESDNP